MVPILTTWRWESATASKVGSGLVALLSVALLTACGAHVETGAPPAAAVRRQLPTILKIIKEMGELRSLTFKGVGYDGRDVYYVTFDHGLIEWRIAPLSADGKVGWRGYRRLH